MGIAETGSLASGAVVLQDAALFTDLYELTMAASYFREGMAARGTFSLFVRRLPKERSFLIAAGLEDVLNYLRSFRFTSRALEYLRFLDRFEPEFLEHLRTLRFTGDVWAMAEGTPFFPDEPLLEITAPIVQAQLVETAVLNLCHFQTVLTSKAARCVWAARGRPIVEFGLRRAPGLDAGMKAARCAFIAGAEASSNALAGLEYGIPPTGTMAHSYVSAFPHEIDAFRAFARAFPSGTILLIDTYDTIAAAHHAVLVAREMEQRGARLGGVRIDSGDIAALSKEVRRILDGAGLQYVRIFVSGGLDEHQIEEWLAGGAPIDAFGVGTRMDVSSDAPYLDMAYKLVRYSDRYVLKTSTGKATWAGEKQVYRSRNAQGRCVSDRLALRDEPPPAEGEPLLHPVMCAGRIVTPSPPLPEVRRRCAARMAELPDSLRRLDPAGAYTVEHSTSLVTLQRHLLSEVAAEYVASPAG